MTPLDAAMACADCAAMQQLDPFAMCKPHEDYWRAPLAWVEARLDDDNGETS